MTINCIIIEDQPPAQRILKKYISDVQTLALKGVFNEPTSAMLFLQNHNVDLVFLDIHLPKFSGIEFLKILPDPPAVILTTAFSDYALEGYELNVVDYLLKPFSFQRFVQAISKVPPRLQPGELASKEIFIKSGYEHIKVVVDEIIYIQSDADYTELILPKNKVLSPEPLKYWEETLDSNQFARVHKSYVVNLKMVSRISATQVFLTNDHHVPIGRAYKEGFVQRYLK